MFNHISVPYSTEIYSAAQKEREIEKRKKAQQIAATASNPSSAQSSNKNLSGGPLTASAPTSPVTCNSGPFGTSPQSDRSFAKVKVTSSTNADTTETVKEDDVESTSTNAHLKFTSHIRRDRISITKKEQGSHKKANENSSKPKRIKASSKTRSKASEPPLSPPPPPRRWNKFVTTTSAPDYQTTFIPCTSIECFSDLLSGTDFGPDMVSTRVTPDNAITYAKRDELHPFVMNETELESFNRAKQQDEATDPKKKKSKEALPREVSNAIFAKKLIPDAMFPKGISLFDIFHHFFDDNHMMFFEYHAARQETDFACQQWQPVRQTNTAAGPTPSDNTSGHLFGAGQRTFTCNTLVKVVGNTVCVFTEYQRYAFIKIRKANAPPVSTDGKDNITNFHRYLVVQVSGQATGAMFTDTFRAETIMVLEEHDNFDQNNDDGLKNNLAPFGENVTVTMHTFGSIQFVKSLWGMIKTKILNAALGDEIPASYKKMFAFLNDRMGAVAESDRQWYAEQLLSTGRQKTSDSVLGSLAGADDYQTTSAECSKQSSVLRQRLGSSGLVAPTLSVTQSQGGDPYNFQKVTTTPSSTLVPSRPPLAAVPWVSTPLASNTTAAQLPNPAIASLSSSTWIAGLRPAALFGQSLGAGIGQSTHGPSVLALPVIGMLAFVFSLTAIKCLLSVMGFILPLSSSMISDASTQLSSDLVALIVLPVSTILLAICCSLAFDFWAEALRLYNVNYSKSPKRYNIAS